MEERGIESGALEDDEVVFHRHAARVDIERGQQFSDRQRARYIERIAIQGDRQRGVTTPNAQFYPNCFSHDRADRLPTGTRFV